MLVRHSPVGSSAQREDPCMNMVQKQVFMSMCASTASGNERYATTHISKGLQQV